MEKISTRVLVEPAEARPVVRGGERWQLVGQIGDISHIGGKALHLVILSFRFVNVGR